MAFSATGLAFSPYPLPGPKTGGVRRGRCLSSTPCEFLGPPVFVELAGLKLEGMATRGIVRVEYDSEQVGLQGGFMSAGW